MDTNKILKTLDNAVMATWLSSRRFSKPGEAYNSLSQETKDILKKLKSRDLEKVRPDSIIF